MSQRISQTSLAYVPEFDRFFGVLTIINILVPVRRLANQINNKHDDKTALGQPSDDVIADLAGPKHTPLN